MSLSTAKQLSAIYQGTTPSLLEHVPVSPSSPNIANLTALTAPLSAEFVPVKLLRLVLQ